MTKRRIPTHGPAGRAYALAQQILLIPEDAEPQAAWRHLFGLQEDSSSATLGFAMSRAVGTLIKAQSMFHGEELESEFPDPYPHLIKVFASMHTDIRWRDIRNMVNAQAKANLALAATFLAQGAPPEELEKDVLDEIRQRASDLRQEVADAQIDAWLSVVLREHLEGILNAIDLYAVEGQDGLRDAFLRSWGDLLVQGEQVKETLGKGDSCVNKKVVQKVIDFLKDYSVVVRAARDASATLAAGSYLLQNLPG